MEPNPSPGLSHVIFMCYSVSILFWSAEGCHSCSWKGSEFMIVVFLRIAYLWCCSTMTEKLEEKLECSRLDSFSFESGSDA